MNETRDMTDGTIGTVDTRRLRRFGLTVGTAFLVVALLLLWRGRGFWPWLAGGGGALALAGWWTPRLLGPVERAWMRAALAMGWVMTRVILGIVFLLIFTPAGLIMKILRQDPLELRFPGRAASYWRKRTDQDRSPARMERMF